MKRRMKKKFIVFIIILTSIICIGNLGILKGLQNNKYRYNKEENNHNKYLKLVNKENSVKITYKPEELIKLDLPFLSDSIDEEKYMDKTAGKAIKNLFEDAKKENINLIGSSAYRSYKTQISIFNKNVKVKGFNYTKQYVALPGKSEHQTGLSIDITNESRCFDKTSLEAQWLANNAYKHGFILRYPEGKEDITGYSYEPWHVRYVGKDVAKEIYNNNWTLEEYLEMKN